MSDASKTNEALIEETRSRHKGAGMSDPFKFCWHCEDEWPCDASRLADALEAATRQPSVIDRDMAIDAIAGGTISVPGGYGDLHGDDAANIVDAIIGQAAVPDAANKALDLIQVADNEPCVNGSACECDQTIIYRLREELIDTRAERDAAVAAIVRVRAVLKTEKFDVSEAALCVDNVIMVADVERAINGPTAAEKLEAEIEKHDDFYWSDDAGDLVCAECKSVLSEDDNFKCPRVAELGAGDSGE